MRRGLLLLLLRAAADDRVVPRRQDTAVPPWLVRGADLEAVPLDVTRVLPLDRGAGSARTVSGSAPRESHGGTAMPCLLRTTRSSAAARSSRRSSPRRIVNLASLGP